MFPEQLIDNVKQRIIFQLTVPERQKKLADLLRIRGRKAILPQLLIRLCKRNRLGNCKICRLLRR